MQTAMVAASGGVGIAGRILRNPLRTISSLVLVALVSVIVWMRAKIARLDRTLLEYENYIMEFRDQQQQPQAGGGGDGGGGLAGIHEAMESQLLPSGLTARQQQAMQQGVLASNNNGGGGGGMMMMDAPQQPRPPIASQQQHQPQGGGGNALVDGNNRNGGGGGLSERARVGLAIHAETDGAGFVGDSL